ncbi:MAG: DUF4160 domain-containing protein [Saprospiraceae bacterium]|uniref:DUF4160 domain-containing protein n=1 Tax=Candidatus Opimibacter skivensis TaxID=2982028 RepID=A0A9D7SU75_9BACT|nr:DUF4160 domain-containing protein [Candidatus Opimibacter skivensis]
MPEISRFYGILIKMYFIDHNPPHFHAEYGEYRAEYNIRSLEVIDGKLPGRAHALVIEWASIHQNELLDNWTKAQLAERLKKIRPLD